MITDEHTKKVKRMRSLETERRHRIFNDKQRLIGIDKHALENQIHEKLLHQQRLQVCEEAFKKNLNFYNEQAIQEEHLVKHQAYKEAENLRQIENMLLAKQQKLRNKIINDAALANIPTEEYYSYFNVSSR